MSRWLRTADWRSELDVKNMPDFIYNAMNDPEYALQLLITKFVSPSDKYYKLLENTIAHELATARSALYYKLFKDEEFIEIAKKTIQKHEDEMRQLRDRSRQIEWELDPKRHVGRVDYD